MRKQGFSLVELSIVLVILGLLTGGILAGQSLIRAAELRSVSVDMTRYRTAFYSFRDKYMGLPGDIINATSIWGAQAGTGTGYDATCAALSTPSTGTATCNGNGDGHIGTAGSADWEIFRAWQQLANAGLVEGTYTGIAGSGGARNRVPGSNIPMLRIKPAGYGIEWTGQITSSIGMYDGDYAHIAHLGANNNASANTTPFLKPEEAWNLDTKIDDGKPAYGTVRSFTPQRADNALCATTITPSSATYNLTDSGIDCALMVVNNF